MDLFRLTRKHITRRRTKHIEWLSYPRSKRLKPSGRAEDKDNMH